MHGIRKCHSWNNLGSSEYDVRENFISDSKGILVMIKTMMSRVHMKSLNRIVP